MIAVLQSSNPLKKIRWDLGLLYLYMLTPYLIAVNLMQDATDNAKITLIVLWYTVPIAWLICSATVNVFFEKQFGSFYNNDTHEMDHTRPVKRKLVLWFSPIALPYYIIKVSLIELWHHRSQILELIIQPFKRS